MPLGANKITNSAFASAGARDLSRYTPTSNPLSKLITVAGPNAASTSALLVLPMTMASPAFCIDTAGLLNKGVSAPILNQPDTAGNRGQTLIS